jgi:hypothetical protein
MGRGFYVGRTRVSHEIWDADFAMSGWVELAQMWGYLPPGASVGLWLFSSNKNAADLIRPRVK